MGWTVAINEPNAEQFAGGSPVYALALAMKLLESHREVVLTSPGEGTYVMRRLED